MMEAAIIGGISGLVNTGLQFAGNKFLTDQTNEQQLKLWREQNEYNSPVNQMARLKAAGLNPALVYGHGSVVGNSQTAPPQLRQAEVPNPDIGSEIAKYSQVNNQQQQGENLRIQNDLLKLQALQTAAATKKTQAEIGIANEQKYGIALANEKLRREMKLSHDSALPDNSPWWAKKIPAVAGTIFDPLDELMTKWGYENALKAFTPKNQPKKGGVSYGGKIYYFNKK